MKNMRLGDMLLAAGVISDEQLQAALVKQKESRERLGTVLIDEGFITEDQLVGALKQQLGIDLIDLTRWQTP